MTCFGVLQNFQAKSKYVGHRRCCCQWWYDTCRSTDISTIWQFSWILTRKEFCTQLPPGGVQIPPSKDEHTGSSTFLFRPLLPLHTPLAAASSEAPPSSIDRYPCNRSRLTGPRSQVVGSDLRLNSKPERGAVARISILCSIPRAALGSRRAWSAPLPTRCGSVL